MKRVRILAWLVAILLSACSGKVIPNPPTGDAAGDAGPGDAVPGDAVPGDAVPGDAAPGDAIPGDSSAPTCTDLMQNGNETDVDCGGGTCPTCANGSQCAQPSDCQSTLCVGGTCVAASCTNSAIDTGETDVDCGGPDCAPCADGDDCALASDCDSAVCGAGNSCPSPPCQCQAPACNDGVQNGDETDTDCGGSCVAAGLTCGDSAECALPADCDSGVCGAGNSCANPPCQCQAPACDDGIQNGDETGDDCGGSCASQGNTCPDGTPCDLPADCTSGECDGICIPPHCSNGATDADESDLNCGGADCAPCTDGQSCNLPGDCVNAVCGVGNSCPSPPCLCQAPSCVPADGIQNGSETDVDCGGGGCPACADGSDCAAATDCSSGVCGFGNLCATPPCACQGPSCTPPDGVHNGSETDTDCGGSGCPTCADGADCALPGDCDSGVCGVGNVCPSPPCACEVPTCTDGVLNQDERGIDCAGACLTSGLTCPAGTPCDDPTECSSGFCNGSCQSASCVPPDGLMNGSETDIDCGGPDCAGCAIGDDCLVGTDCLSGSCGAGDVCEVVSCGDGTKTPAEECDYNGTPSDFADDDLGGLSCVDFFFSGGTLGCTPACTFDMSQCTGGCGNGGIDGSELCDGADLGGETCGGLGYDAGPGLACTADCAFDTSGCTSSSCPSCPPGAYCSVDTDYTCTCPIYQTACSSGCISLQTDPLNCGSCGHACQSGEACSAGQCQSTCPLPLVNCSGRCIDPQTDSTYCGASGDCGISTGSVGDDCIANYSPDQICLSGGCSDPTSGEDYTGAGDAPTRCVGGGPVLDINTGLGCDPTEPDDPDCVVDPSLGCTGDLAAVTFRYALCSCSDIDTSHPLFADGFNSSLGPYDPTCEDGTPCLLPGSDNGSCSSDANGDGHATCADQKGAGIGANGIFDNSQLTTVWGTMWLSNGNPATYPDQNLPPTTVEQQLHIGNSLSGGPVHVRGDGRVVSNVSATGTFGGTLYQSTGTFSSMAASGFDRSANPLVVGEACDCSAEKLIDVAGIVDAHSCLPEGTSGCSGTSCCDTSNNNNSDIGLDPRLMDSPAGDVRLDLPCGQYSFTRIVAGSNTTVSIVAHGRTAIYIDEHLDIPKNLNITLTDAAELDVFVKGGVCNNDTIFVGSPSYPARVRFYVGGGDLLSGGSGITCATNSTRAMALKSIVGAANMYAPYGEVYMPQTFTLYGSIFAGRARIVQDATFHFDTGITDAAATCEHCGDNIIDPGEACDGTALGGTTCADLGYTGGPLACTPTCTFDTSACCGDGVRGGIEECDASDLGGLSCGDFGQSGTLACSASCTFEGCTGICNPDGMLDAGEECDPGNPLTEADTFPAGRDTCTLELGIPAGGALACDANCEIDTAGCTYCGDGLMNGSEECDGNDFDTAAGEQNAPPPCASGPGAVTCSGTCLLDTSGCAGCTGCRDCNNQACIGGVCSSCTDSSQCCSPLLCVGGTCRVF